MAARPFLHDTDATVGPTQRLEPGLSPNKVDLDMPAGYEMGNGCGKSEATTGSGGFPPGRVNNPRGRERLGCSGKKGPVSHDAKGLGGCQWVFGSL